MSNVSRKALSDMIPGLDSDFKVVNAEKPLKIAPTRADAKRAQRLDPANCLYGQACQRRGMPGVFLRKVAYVKASPKTVRKYAVPAAGRAQIIALDASGIATHGVSITLVPPKGDNRVGGRAGDGSQGTKGSPLTKAQLAKRHAERDALPELRQVKAS